MESKNGEGVPCTTCNAVFEDVLGLLAHLETHSLECNVCRKQFTSKEFLDQHMKTHDDDHDQANEVGNQPGEETTKINTNGNSPSEKTSKTNNGKHETEEPASKETNNSQSEKKPIIEREEAVVNAGSRESSASPGPNKKTDKPYRCSKCKYVAKSVASVNMHQRKQHPGEWATVISTLDDREIHGERKGPVKQGKDDADDTEVSLALQDPLPASDSEDNEEGDGNNKPPEYRCSICDFTATDTDSVFEHQREKHPDDFQIEGDDRGEIEEEEEDEPDPMFQLPIDLDHFSSMGRSIIAGGGDEEQGNSQMRQQPSNSSSSNMIDSQGFSPLTGKYHCSNCPAYFYESSHLRRHHNACKNTGYLNHALAKYRCTMCKRVFPDKQTLMPHMLNHQKNYARFRCGVCGYKGKFEGTIIAHVNQKHPGGPPALIEQIATQEEANAVSTLWEHLGPGDGDESAGTEYDPDLQQVLSGLIQKVPSADRNDSGEFDTQSQTSELSDDSISEPAQWSAESLASLKFGNNYMCPECPVLFREPYKLKRHLDSHGGIKRHVCKICNKRFTRSEHLRRHRVVHANTKPYMCNICCYSAKRLDNLQKHQRVKHPGEKVEVIRVSKEMIEAEIAANENARNTTPERPQMPIQRMPPQPQVVIQPAVVQPMMMPIKAKRGRPRKISSPSDNFFFYKDPDYQPIRTPMSLPPPTMPLDSSFNPSGLSLNRPGLNLNMSGGNMNTSGNLNIPIPNLTQGNTNGVHNDVSMKLASGGNLSYNNPLAKDPLLSTLSRYQGPSSHLYNQHQMFGSPDMASTPMRLPGFDLSRLTAAAAAAAMGPDNKSQPPLVIKPDPSLLAKETNPGADTLGPNPVDSLPPAIGSHLGVTEQDKTLLAMGLQSNRGRYQCHVCDRPFSYLKPFKKHLLCHGTFMPYECSICGLQTKRRDMMQDHQRDAHPGRTCSIKTKEPTSDMHDMMDTYIQQVPEQQLQDSPSQMQGSGAGFHPSHADRSRVDPQFNYPMDMVKMEPVDKQSPSATSSPKLPQQQIDNAKAGPRTRSQLRSTEEPQKLKENPIIASVIKSDRATNSPITFSEQTPESEASVLRPRPRRAAMVKFKVLSSHTKAMSKAPIEPTLDMECNDSSGPSSLNDPSDFKADPANENEMCRLDEEWLDEPEAKRPRMSRDQFRPTSYDENFPGSFPSSAALQMLAVKAPLIGQAPKVPIMGMRQTRAPRPAQEALVINIKSHKGSPKEKQGNNHKFVCSVCDQRFAYEKPFKRHLLVHGGFQPYKCNGCGLLTTSRDTMKIHQNKDHPKQGNVGITVLEPTAEMEQSLVRQGLLQKQPLSENEEEDEEEDEEEEVEDPNSKSIVETQKIEQHMIATAMKSSMTKTQPKAPEGPQSFPMMLGLRPASDTMEEEDEEDEPEAGTSGLADTSTVSSNSEIMGFDELSDMPVDDAIFTLQEESRMMLEPRDGGYKCNYCGKAFVCPSKLQRHMISHTGIKAYECQICFKKLTRLEHLKRHLLTHGNVKPYRCSACRFDAKRLDIVQLHQQMSHPGEPVEIVYLFQPSVMESSPSKPGAVSQSPPDDGASEEGSYPCHVCGMSFLSVNHLMAHSKNHASSKPYECFICHKSFTRPEHLKRHRLVHDDTKPYRCSECGFKTKRLDGMREHQRSRHPQIQTFIIDTMLEESPNVKRKRGRPPKFGPRDSLDGLQLLHCDKCCLAFYDQGRFEQHKLMHIPSPTKPENLTCHLCGVRVSQAKHLRRHMLLHESHTPYQCSLCGYSAKRTDHMKLHFRKQHPDGGAQTIYIAKDDGTGEPAPPMVLSDDSMNDHSSLGQDSFFEGYPMGDIAEADLTIDQLNQMAQGQEFNYSGNTSLTGYEGDNPDFDDEDNDDVEEEEEFEDPMMGVKTAKDLEKNGDFIITLKKPGTGNSSTNSSDPVADGQKDQEDEAKDQSSSQPQGESQTAQPVVESDDQQVQESDQPVEESDQQVEESDQPVEESDQQVEETDQQVEESDQLVEESDLPSDSVTEKS